MTTPQPTQPDHPLTIAGAITAIIHMCKGKRFSETIPQVQAELVSIEYDFVEDLITESEDGDD